MSLFNFFRKNNKIKADKYNTKAFQTEIIEKAKKWFFENGQDYNKITSFLKEEGLNQTQILDIQEKLKLHIQEMTEAVKKELDSGKLRIEVKSIESDSNSANNNKDLVDKHIGFGAFQMDRGEFDNALELFNKAIALDDRASLAYANLGTLYARKEDYEQALSFYNKALDIEPNHK